MPNSATLHWVIPWNKLSTEADISYFLLDYDHFHDGQSTVPEHDEDLWGGMHTTYHLSLDFTISAGLLELLTGLAYSLFVNSAPFTTRGSVYIGLRKW